jgi:vitamin B12 transporter
MIRKQLYLHFLFALLTSSASRANTPDSLQQVLDEVNIVASRAVKSSLETPRSVTVLTREDLEKASYITLGDVLQEQAGMYVVGSGQAPGSNQSIFLRGANSNQTVVFIDGIRIQDVSTINGVADMSELPLSDIERVEILRGAQGTLYGTNACGGVIRITTRPDSLKNGYHGRFGARAGLFGENGRDAGSYGSLSYNAPSGWYLRTGSDYFTAAGFNATLDTGYVLPELRPDADPWQKGALDVAAGYSSASTSLHFFYRTLSSNTSIDAGAYKDDDNYVLDFRRKSAGTEMSFVLTPNWTFNAGAGWSVTDRNALNDSSVSLSTGLNDRTRFRDDYNGRQFSSEISFRYRDNSTSFVGGLSFLSEAMNQRNEFYSAQYAPFILSYSTDLDTLSPTARNTAAFIHGDINGTVFHSSLDRWNLLFGARINYHDICGIASSFDLSPLFRINDRSRLFASLSTGFTNPSLYQLFAPDSYFPWDGQPSSGLTRGNKSLQPEKTLSAEIGYKTKVNDKIELEASVFRSFTENLIDYVYLWDGAFPIAQLGTDFNRDDYRGDRYMNIGDQTVYGFELGLSARLNDRFLLRMNGTVLDGYLEQSRVELSGSFHYQSYATGIFLGSVDRYDGLLRRPSTLLAALDYSPIGKLTLSFQIRYTGKRPDIYYDSALGPFGALNRKAVAAYTLADFSAVWRPTTTLCVNLRIENLLNVDYQEIYGFRTRGRGVQLGVSFAF